MQRRAFFIAIGAMGLAGSIASADVTISIAETRNVAPTAEGIHFDLLLLNDDAATAEKHDVPPTLNVQVTTAGGTYDAVATRVDRRGDAQTLSLNPGGFLRVSYIVDRHVEGAVTVALHDGTASGIIRPRDVQSGRPVPATSPAASPTGPLEAIVEPDPNYKSELGLVEYLANRIKPHEPVYIIAGDENPTTKFQFSFKYQVLDPEGPIAQEVPALAGVYFAYSQTSLWDLGANSSPFFDTSYRPEALLSYEKLDRFWTNSAGVRVLPDWLTLSAQGGIRHESNGKDGDASRSMNIVYVKPIVTFAGKDGWFLTIAPTIFSYIYDLSDNPDIADYRGHAELRLVMGQGGGVQLAAVGRLGDNSDHGSLEFDLTVPIRKLSLGNLDVYFTTQYFMGYGETMLTYDEKSYALRFGISLVR